MIYRDTRRAERALRAIAVDRGGYFTAKEAKVAGYDYPHLDYHVRSGNFERIGHGVYRFPDIPASEHDELIRLALWSRRRDDRAQAVVSHATAAALHDLGDMIPSDTHLTVPRSFRKKPPAGCVLHKDALPTRDVEEWTGFCVTTSMRTLLDLAATDTPQEQLERAVAAALDRGLVRRTQLLEAVTAHPRSQRLSLVRELVNNRR